MARPQAGRKQPGKGTKESKQAVKPRKQQARRAAAATPAELDVPANFLNRELTWLAFNRRVLHEAVDPRTPLLERVKFVAIVSSNLDEFFMKRIGGLKQQVGAGIVTTTIDGRTPRQQIVECYDVVRELESVKLRLFDELHLLLREKGIEIVSCGSLDPVEQKALRDYYFKNIYPLATPQAIDPAHPFPFISNLSLNLLVALRYPRDPEISLARVKVPTGGGTNRFIPVGDGHRYVTVEDVMAHNLDLLFPGMEVVSCELFRVTRNANTEKYEEEADDLLAVIESELKDRRFAPIVRLEVHKDMAPMHRGMLAAELELDGTADVFEVPGMLSLRDLFELSSLDFPELRDAPHQPVDHPSLTTSRNIFHTIREEGAILLQHPYESFATSVERFLFEAAQDPKVRAIKMTLYRTSRDSRLVDALIEAAENGKQVAVVVELRARFDEAANIRIAERMEEAGVHVTYGVVGLKTHCKVVLVVRQDYTGIQRYVHIGTGNYHPGTARLYCDLGMLTFDEQIGQDVTELFNYLTTGYTPKRTYLKILPAPKHLKKALLAKIAREIAGHSASSPGLIQFKMNALEDADIVTALYRASQAGVHVDLVVRDTCRLVAGVPGLSENIRVISVVGRFLEHSRIYYFRNGGDEEYFIGSADAMKRNLEARVEVVAPVELPSLRRELRTILDTHLTDRRSAWEMQPDGSYVQTGTAGSDAPGSQAQLIALAEKRQKAARRLKKRKSAGIIVKTQPS